MDIDKLREESRRRYLEKRVASQARIKRDLIDGKKAIVGEDHLTELDKREIQIDESILELSKRVNEKSTPLEYRLDQASETGSTLDERLNSVSKFYSAQEQANPLLQRSENWEKAKMASARILPSSHAVFESHRTETQVEGVQDFRAVQEALPIFKYKQDLLDTLDKHQIVIVVGNTGSGKTTQIPQYLLERPSNAFDVGQNGERVMKPQSVVCTQPRRVAAMAVAARVAAERHCELGFEVGYSVRFEEVTTSETRIRYMTDGRLLREFLLDPFLSSYTTIMIDEAHERSVSTDILLSLLKDLAIARPELRIVISSATLDAENMSKFFGNVPIMYVPGRLFDVNIMYTASNSPDYCYSALLTTLYIHKNEPIEQPCDILVFLTGQDEIDDCVSRIQEMMKNTGMKPLVALPLYAALPAEKQAEVFRPAQRGCRKVIFATNIAETSITIETIRYVVDSGMVKQVAYDPRTGCESLDIVPVSVSSAAQRAGRAGRICNGVCYRLFTKATFENEMPKMTKPELLRCNFAPTLLLLLSMGIDTIVDFNFLDPPSSRLVEVAYEQLYSMAAINYERKLTDLGDQMSKLPVSPYAARSIIESWKLKCPTAVITICAVLEAGSPLFFAPKDDHKATMTAIKAFWDKAGDHMTILNVYRAWEQAGNSRQWCIENHVQYRTLIKAKDIKEQLFDICEQMGLECEEDEVIDNISKAFVYGFFSNSAYLAEDGLYYTIRSSSPVNLHPSSCLVGPDAPLFCIFYELVMTTKPFMRTVIKIDPYWLRDASPHLFKVIDGPKIRVTC